jgi:hypothetical protein
MHIVSSTNQGAKPKNAKALCLWHSVWRSVLACRELGELGRCYRPYVISGSPSPHKEANQVHSRRWSRIHAVGPLAWIRIRGSNPEFLFVGSLLGSGSVGPLAGRILGPGPDPAPALSWCLVPRLCPPALPLGPHTPVRIDRLLPNPSGA